MIIMMMTINKHNVPWGWDEFKTYIWGSVSRGLLRSFLVGAVLTCHEILGKSLSLSAFPSVK